MSATTTKNAAMPSGQELGDIEALVYVAFERIEQLEVGMRAAANEEQGATPEECWNLHSMAAACKSWAESIVESCEQLQQHALGVGVGAIEAGIVNDYTGETQRSLQRIIEVRRAEGAPDPDADEEASGDGEPAS